MCKAHVHFIEMRARNKMIPRASSKIECRIVCLVYEICFKNLSRDFLRNFF